MIRRELSILAMVLFSILSSVSVPVYGQSRVLVGPAGTAGPNMALGSVVSLEVPSLHRYEIDLKDTFYPLEWHVGLGTGLANVARTGGIAWITSRVGIDGSWERSSYGVTDVSKTAYYTFGGIVFRFIGAGHPVRLRFDYIRQIANGISPDGVETNHVQGVESGLDVRKCTKSVCFRLTDEFEFTHILNQGNPVCDGTWGNGLQAGIAPCHRSGSIAANANMSLAVEFPRRRSTENLPF